MSFVAFVFAGERCFVNHRIKAEDAPCLAFYEPVRMRTDDVFSACLCADKRRGKGELPVSGEIHMQIFLFWGIIWLNCWNINALRAAGCAVAMGNATPQIKEIADLVVADNDHDGIVEAIERLF